MSEESLRQAIEEIRGHREERNRERRAEDKRQDRLGAIAREISSFRNAFGVLSWCEEDAVRSMAISIAAIADEYNSNVVSVAKAARDWNIAATRLSVTEFCLDPDKSTDADFEEHGRLIDAETRARTRLDAALREWQEVSP